LRHVTTLPLWRLGTKPVQESNSVRTGFGVESSQPQARVHTFLQFVIGFAGVLAMIAGAVVVYYVVSYTVLRGFGLLFPLGGWRARKKSR
jgi:hypothetical protein